jgi:hypothetical protein
LGNVFHYAGRYIGIDIFCYGNVGMTHVFRNNTYLDPGFSSGCGVGVT